MSTWTTETTSIIFQDEDGFEVCWGIYGEATKKCLGVKWPTYPPQRGNAPNHVVIPEFLTQSIFDRILSYAIVNDYPISEVTPIQSALKEWVSYSMPEYTSNRE